MSHPEPFPTFAVSARMLSRLALASVVFLMSCAPASPLPAKAPEVCAEQKPPAPPVPIVVKSVEVKPALTLEPLVAGEVARWKITNHSSEPLQLGIEQVQQHWARDCRSPLQRIDNDGRVRCMPIRIETNVPAYAKLDPGASAVLGFSMQFDSRGPEPALPAGRYQLIISTTNLKDRSNGPTARTNFRVEGLNEEEARSLSQRVAFATEHGCSATSEVAQRALAWTAPEAISLAALDLQGVPWMRARYARFAAMLPEAQEKLRKSLNAHTFDSAVATNALLWARTQPPAEVREEALRALPRSLSVSGFDPILVQAVASSDYRASILEAVAWRVTSREDEAELGSWEAGLACAAPRPGDELPFADLIQAFRMRAKKAKPELAKALRDRADTFETLLRERRNTVDEALRIARSGRPPFHGPNTASLGKGCGYATSGVRPDAACAGTDIQPNDPAVRFLSTPMTLHIE